jgi:hypothetical protein
LPDWHVTSHAYYLSLMKLVSVNSFIWGSMVIVTRRCCLCAIFSYVTTLLSIGNILLECKATR